MLAPDRVDMRAGGFLLTLRIRAETLAREDTGDAFGDRGGGYVHQRLSFTRING
jgi:hypothetical protein